MITNNLSFLEEVLAPQKDKYKEAAFLKSEFDANVWVIALEDKKDYTINFHIELKPGTYLTDIKHIKTLTTLKYWIIESIYDKNTHLCTASTIIRKVNAALTIFDCINLFDNKKLVLTSGLSFLNTDYFKHILFKLSEDANKFENIYNTSERLLNYYKKTEKIDFNHLSELDELNINKFLKKINEDELTIKKLFPDTILKPNKWPKSLIEASSTRYYLTEYPTYFREQKEQGGLSPVPLQYYRNAIDILKKLEKKFRNDNRFSFPNKQAFEGIDKFSIQTKEKGRFETYPAKVIFNSFKEAVEFHFNYGEEIIQSFVNFIENIKKQKIDTDNFDSSPEIQIIFEKSLTKKLIDLGVKELKQERPDKNRFNLIRNNYYLFDLLKIYYGAVQFVVGALMARRQSELASLSANDCVHEINNVLIFKRSKSAKGLFGVKDTLALPIDPLAIKMIKNLQKIHIALNSNGKLFAMPTFKNPTKIKSDTSGNYYGQNLDLFMDYIEAPIVDGKRLYIRQHQLRRFFAMSFFWGSGFGSMDTLRWFMGHTDIQHLYHYITESTPGEVLRSVKAQYVAEDFAKYHDLAQLIKERYHTENFDIIESDELTYYIESLLESGDITIEPEFLVDDKDNKFEIIVKVIKDKK